MIHEAEWHRGMFSTLEGYHDLCGDTMSTSGGVQYIDRIP